MTKNLYLIVGPSGVGKTTLVNFLQDHGYTKAVSYTTRHWRDEEDRYSYHFITHQAFKALPDLVESTTYDSHQYGTTYSELDKSDIHIVDLEGVRIINANYRNRPAIAIGLTAPRDVLAERLKERGKEEECRLNYDDSAFQWMDIYCDVCFESVDESCFKKVLQFIQEKENT